MIPSIWTSMYRRAPFCEALRGLASCGWAEVEISTEHLCEIETAADPKALIADARKLMSELGISGPQAHGLLRANVADADENQRREDISRLARHIEIAAEFGVRVIVMHPGGRQGFTTYEDKKRLSALNVEAFRRLGDLAAERGMRIGMENTMNRMGGTPPDLLEILEAIGHPAMGVTFDTSHANVMKLDIPAAIREFGSRIIAVHLSDNDGSGDQHRFPGCGTVDWPGVMRALGGIGFTGPLNFEIPGECHEHPEIQRAKVRHARELADWLLEKGTVPFSEKGD